VLLVAAAHNVLRDWRADMALIISWLGGASLIYVRLVRPARVAHKEHEKERFDLRAENTSLKSRQRVIITSVAGGLVAATMFVAMFVRSMARDQRH
jgi:hypothetical protein